MIVWVLAFSVLTEPQDSTKVDCTLTEPSHMIGRGISDISAL